MKYKQHYYCFYDTAEDKIFIDNITVPLKQENIIYEILYPEKYARMRRLRAAMNNKYVIRKTNEILSRLGNSERGDVNDDCMRAYIKCLELNSK